MGVGERGYIMTLTTSLMIITVLSLVLFYLDASSPSMEDASDMMTLSEMHYYAASLKKDAGRAVTIAAQRAATYATNHVMLTGEDFGGYGMRNCSDYNYSMVGSGAAIGELMVCGTLLNAVQPTSDIGMYMENNTINEWVNKTNNNRGLPYTTTVRFRNLTLAMYDSWHLVVVSEFDFNITDPTGRNGYRYYYSPIISLVDIKALEDPMQDVRFGLPTAARTYDACESARVVNGTVLDGWVESGCYHSAPSYLNSPSFLDRLEARVNLSDKGFRHSGEVMAAMNYTLGDIGLESMVNLDGLRTYGYLGNGNLSNVDYMYWNGINSTCMVKGMEKHPGLRIDWQHSKFYGVVGLTCTVDVTTGGLGEAVFYPTDVIVPYSSEVVWVEKSGSSYSVTSGLLWSGVRSLPAYGALAQPFNVSVGVYAVGFQPDGGGPQRFSFVKVL